MYNKYLKYKSKYLNLKMIGGVIIDIQITHKITGQSYNLNVNKDNKIDQLFKKMDEFIYTISESSESLILSDDNLGITRGYNLYINEDEKPLNIYDDRSISEIAGADKSIKYNTFEMKIKFNDLTDFVAYINENIYINNFYIYIYLMYKLLCQEEILLVSRKEVNQLLKEDARQFVEEVKDNTRRFDELSNNIVKNITNTKYLIFCIIKNPFFLGDLITEEIFSKIPLYVFNNKDFILKAINITDEITDKIIPIISNLLFEDAEFVLKAIKISNKLIYKIPSNFFDNKNFILEAIKITVKIFPKIPFDVFYDTDFVLEAMKITVKIFPEIPFDVFDNTDFILKAINITDKITNKIIPIISHSLLSNTEFMLKAIRISDQLIYKIPYSLLNNLDFMSEAMQISDKLTREKCIEYIVNHDFLKFFKCYLDKKFYFGLANFTKEYDHLMLIGKRVEEIKDPDNEFSFDVIAGKEYLYYLQCTNNKFEIDNFINKLNSIFVYQHFLYTTVKSYKKSFDTDDTIKLKFIKSSDNVISALLSCGTSINVYDICYINEYKDEVYNFINYPIKEDDGNNANSLTFKIEIPNIEEYKKIITTYDKNNYTIIVKKTLLQIPNQIIIVNIDDSLNLDSFYLALNKEEILLIQNKEIGSSPYVYKDGELKHFYKLFEIYNIYVTSGTYPKTTEMKTSNTVCKNAKIVEYIHYSIEDNSITTFMDTKMDKTSIPDFIERIISGYVNGSTDINLTSKKYFLKKEKEWQNKKINIQSIYKIDIRIYIELFMNMAYIINKNIFGNNYSFTVYSISQSLINWNNADEKFKIGDTFIFDMFKSTSLSNKLISNPQFIGHDIFPLIFEIKIKCDSLSGCEYFFTDNNQFEIIITAGSSVEITEVTRCYSYFNKYDKSLAQNCTHVKCNLLKNDFNLIAVEDMTGGDIEVRFPSIVSTNSEQPVQAINTSISPTESKQPAKAMNTSIPQKLSAELKQPITRNINNYREYVIEKINNNPCNMIYDNMIYDNMI